MSILEDDVHVLRSNRFVIAALELITRIKNEEAQIAPSIADKKAQLGSSLSQ